jgi:release factor glutamine methyltransferase
MTKKSIQSIISSWSSKCDILDIELIIAHIFKKDRSFIMTHPEHILDDDSFIQINYFCKKRAQGYPLAYIIGTKQFYGRDFIVNTNTLIPRPETELMIDKIISFTTQKHLSNICIVDIGTGSGIIAITLAKELIKLNITTKIYAIDISNDALSIARKNAKTHNVSDKITFYQSDLLSNTFLQTDLQDNDYSNIIFAANLPYVDISIEPELTKNKESQSLIFEPRLALWSDDFGLSHYKKLITQTTSLKKNITSFYEIDPKQYAYLTQYIQDISTNIKINCYKDLSDKERIIQWSLNKT